MASPFFMAESPGQERQTQVVTLPHFGAVTMPTCVSAVELTLCRPPIMSSTLFSPRRAVCALGLAALGSQAALAGSTNVGVSVSVAQPGFYGRVDIGDQPPTLIYPQPVIIQQAPVAVYQRPIYMRVPPGHYKNWARYCGQYRACNQPVYFVREDYRRDGDWTRGERDERRDGWDHHGRDDDRGEDRGEDRGDDRGRGHGKGHGRGHGH